MNHIQWVKSPKIFTNRSSQAEGGGPPPQAVSLTAFPSFFYDFPKLVGGMDIDWYPGGGSYRVNLVNIMNLFKL